eukprot:360517-Chlamydomonas_euryale.AAC.3
MDRGVGESMHACGDTRVPRTGKHSAVVEFESLHAPARLSENVVRAIRMVDMDVGLWLMAPPARTQQ